MWKDRDLAEKIQIIAAQLIRILIVIAIVGEIINKRWTLLFATIGILILTFIPTLIEKRYKVHLPIEFEFLIIAFIYASIFLGELKGYYSRLWWWDIVLHTGSGLAFGLIGFLILYILQRNGKIEASPIWISVFSFSFGLAIGAMWEIYEFGMDQLVGANMQGSSLLDTMWDLIVDSIGALIVSIVGFYYIKGKKEPLFNRMLNKFLKENPRFLKN
jgi:hypothetical protein